MTIKNPIRTHQTVAALTTALALAVACPTSAVAAHSAKDVPGITAQAADPARPTPFTALSVADFEQAIANPNAFVIDVRTFDEYDRGRIPLSTNIDWQQEGFVDNFLDLPKDTEFALYCKSSNRSGQAMEALRQAGFTNVYHLSGGFDAWVAAGKPVETVFPDEPTDPSQPGDPVPGDPIPGDPAPTDPEPIDPADPMPEDPMPEDPDFPVDPAPEVPEAA